MRHALVILHRWLGLAGAVFVSTIGVSGSLLVFQPELDRWLNADWSRPSATTGQVSIDRVLAAARARAGTRFLHSVFPPADADDVHHVWLTPSDDDLAAMWEILVDPATGRVLGEREAVPTARFDRRTFFNALYTLHIQLLAGEVGRIGVGVLGIALVISIVGGWMLWWPRGRFHRKFFLLKRRASGIRRVFDLHRLGGLYGGALLAMIAVTGVFLTFPGWLARADALRIEAASALTPEPNSDETPATRVLSVARRHLPADARITCLWLPTRDRPEWRISARAADTGPSAHRRLEVFVTDAGAVRLQGESMRTGADTFLDWQLPLHNGRAAGLPGRILVALSGVLPMLLGITGTVVWLRKRSARRVEGVRSLRQ